MKNKIIYHVFTNNQDEWVDTLKEAREIYRAWSKEYGCARVYKEEIKDDGQVVEQSCLLSQGEYPL